MSLTEFTRRLVARKLSAYCQGWSPPHGGEKVRLTFRVHWNKVTLSARRTDGEEDGPGSLLPVAQMRYDAVTNKWTLYYADRNAGWHVYPECKASADFDHLLAEIDRDPTGIFQSREAGMR